jgi:hypothetical protein
MSLHRLILIAVILLAIMAASSITKIPLDVSHVYSQAAKITRISTAILNNNSWTNVASSPTPKMESAYTSVGDKIYIIGGYGETGKRNKIV